jgi:serine/threonine-protein kinase HipA
VLLVNDAQQYELSPAFDVLPSGQALGYQQMSVGTNEAESTLENALSMSSLFALKRAEAESEVRTVATAVEQWKAHFAAAGVSARDLESYAEQIDRPFLLDQRREFVQLAG